MNEEKYQVKTGVLKHGIRVGGVYHKKFTIREEILADTIGEVKEVVENFGEDILESEDDKTIAIIKNTVTLKRRLVSLGSLNNEEMEKLTAKDIFSTTSEDYAILIITKTLLDSGVDKLFADATKKVKNASGSKKK